MGKSEPTAFLLNVPLYISIFLWVLLAVAVFGGYGVTLGSRFTYEPVVYAVEDTYQIVFSTNHKATAWVEIEGEEYYELYAGSMKSNDTVHKITVPQGSCWYGCVCGHS